MLVRVECRRGCRRTVSSFCEGGVAAHSCHGVARHLQVELLALLPMEAYIRLTVIPPVQPEIGIGNAMLPLNTLLDIVTGPESFGVVLEASQVVQTQDPTAMPTPNNRCPCIVLLETSTLAKLPLYTPRLSTKLIAPKPAFVVEPTILLDRTLLPGPLNRTIPPSVLPVTYSS